MNNLLSQFECIYIINLASRADRRREMADQLVGVGLHLDSMPVQLFSAVKPADAGEFPSIGSRGCFLSHLGILQRARDEGLHSVLILEDDLNFVADFAERSVSLSQQWTGSTSSIFYGGGAVELETSRDRESGLMSVSPNTPVGLTHFLGFRGVECISDAVGYLEAMSARSAGDPEGGPMHVDGAYSWFRRAHPQYQTVIAHPEIGYQRASRTDIHALRWFDKLAGVRSVVDFVRRLRNG